jgi:hypothetical protein
VRISCLAKHNSRINIPGRARQTDGVKVPPLQLAPTLLCTRSDSFSNGSNSSDFQNQNETTQKERGRYHHLSRSFYPIRSYKAILSTLDYTSDRNGLCPCPFPDGIAPGTPSASSNGRTISLVGHCSASKIE